MSNSKLVQYTRFVPACSKMHNKKNIKITPHHMAGDLSLETCGKVLIDSNCSTNYAIDSEGRIGLYVDEGDRSWASDNKKNDGQAVTIEVANDELGGDWHVSDQALNALVDLCVDICIRNGIDELVYTGDKSGNLTRHNMFTATSCPGPYLQSKFPWIAEQVNQRLNIKSSYSKDLIGDYKVQAVGGLNLRAGASTNNSVIETLDNGSTVWFDGYHIGSWYHVKTRSGKTGYCVKDYLKKEPDKMSEHFSDVPKKAWYAKSVDYCKENGLMSGVGGGKFAPNRPMTRAEAAAVFAKLHSMIEEGKNK